MKNYFIALITLVIAGIGYYFLVAKKAVTTTGGTPTKPPLSDAELQTLTTGKINTLTLDQIDAISYEQQLALTAKQTAEIEAKRKKLEEQAVKDAALAIEAKRIADEKARIEALKLQAASYVSGSIPKLAIDAFKAIPAEIVQYLSPVSKAEYESQKTYFARQEQFQIDQAAIKNNDAKRGQLEKLAKDLSSMFVALFHATDMFLLRKVYELTDAELYYFVKTAYPKYAIAGGSFIKNLKDQESSNGVDVPSARAALGPGTKKQWMYELVVRISQLPA